MYRRIYSVCHNPQAHFPRVENRCPVPHQPTPLNSKRASQKFFVENLIMLSNTPPNVAFRSPESHVERPLLSRSERQQMGNPSATETIRSPPAPPNKGRKMLGIAQSTMPLTKTKPVVGTAPTAHRAEKRKISPRLSTLDLRPKHCLPGVQQFIHNNARATTQNPALRAPSLCKNSSRK